VSVVSAAEAWVAEFHRGGRETFAALYRDHFKTVDAAVGKILNGADKETVIHEVFCQLMTSSEVRQGFHGGSFGAWLMTLSRNRAIDFHRRRRLEQPMGSDPEHFGGAADADSFEPRVEARMLVERFRNGVLPAKWLRVFEVRFVEQLEQPEAARRLGMSRTTLAYQEYRIRHLLQRFVLNGRAKGAG
jgi:RNA polymerase sigma-70 factor (ECF subfamily)